MPIWWRRARISNWSAARLRKVAESEAMTAVSKGPRGNRMMRDNSQFINLIRICENHRRRAHPKKMIIASSDTCRGWRMNGATSCFRN